MVGQTGPRKQSVNIRFPYFLYCKNSWKTGFQDSHSEMIERSTPDGTASRLPRFTSVTGGSIPGAEGTDPEGLGWVPAHHACPFFPGMMETERMLDCDSRHPL